MSTTKKHNGTTRKRRSSLAAGSVAAKRLIQRIAYRMWTNEPDRADGRYTVKCVLEMAGVIRRQNTRDEPRG